MRRLVRVTMLLLIAAVIAVTAGTAQAAADGSPAPLSTDEERAVALVNADRAAQGLPPLAVNMTLVALARDYAQDMIDRRFAAHTSPDGETFEGRLARYGVTYLTAGENLAKNVSVDEATRALMNSPGHRANILSSSFTEVGIGVCLDAKGAMYVVQEFVGR